VFQVVLAESVYPGLVSQQCVLVASETTDIVDDKDVTTLNVVYQRETNVAKKHHRL
jgi:hypothetical protein